MHEMVSLFDYFVAFSSCVARELVPQGMGQRESAFSSMI